MPKLTWALARAAGASSNAAMAIDCRSFLMSSRPCKSNATHPGAHIDPDSEGIYGSIREETWTKSNRARSPPRHLRTIEWNSLTELGLDRFANHLAPHRFV